MDGSSAILYYIALCFNFLIELAGRLKVAAFDSCETIFVETCGIIIELILITTHSAFFISYIQAMFRFVFITQ